MIFYEIVSSGQIPSQTPLSQILISEKFNGLMRKRVKFGDESIKGLTCLTWFMISIFLLTTILLPGKLRKIYILDWAEKCSDYFHIKSFHVLQSFIYIIIYGKCFAPKHENWTFELVYGTQLWDMDSIWSKNSIQVLYTSKEFKSQTQLLMRGEMSLLCFERQKWKCLSFLKNDLTLQHSDRGWQTWCVSPTSQGNALQ